MTLLDQIKADLIDIIGDRKVVNVKDVQNVSRSSVLIDELMEKLGYYRDWVAGVYVMQRPSIRKVSLVQQASWIEVPYGEKNIRFKNSPSNSVYQVFLYLKKHGTASTIQLRKHATTSVLDCVRYLLQKGVMIDIDKSDRNNFVYTLKMP